MFERHLDYKDYWERRYREGGTSGAGSYGEHALYKSTVVNQYIENYRVESALEFGCGDGNQLGLLNIPRYTGLDISSKAVERCRDAYAADASKEFAIYDPRAPLDLGQYDMTFSLEVLMHVINEDDFVSTLDGMFAHSSRLVIIQAPLFELIPYRRGHHERYRELLPYLEPYKFEVIDVLIHPSVTYEQRRAGEVGEMSSDFVILKRPE
jgi:SAM-dependent methyltransferase